MRRQISIHAPRAGGDSVISPMICFCCNFNPRPPCGGRPPSRCARVWVGPFQSTPPVWGATVWSSSLNAYHAFQSTPPVWGATKQFIIRLPPTMISIHAPRVGGDLAIYLNHFTQHPFQSTPPGWGATRMTPAVRRSAAFQSTPPMRGATPPSAAAKGAHQISIHAPMRGATALTLVVVFATIFQSTPPVWGATLGLSKLIKPDIFQSTPPGWGATSP